jgi:hypothetical protein
MIRWQYNGNEDEAILARILFLSPSHTHLSLSFFCNR